MADLKGLVVRETPPFYGGASSDRIPRSKLRIFEELDIIGALSITKNQNLLIVFKNRDSQTK